LNYELFSASPAIRNCSILIYSIYNSKLYNSKSAKPTIQNSKLLTPNCIKYKSGIPKAGIPLLCFMLKSLLLS